MLSISAVAEMTIQIVEFNQKHLPTAAELMNEEYENSSEFIPFDQKRVVSEIRRHNLKVLIAEENGKVLGLVATHPEEHRDISIHWLAIRRGIDHRNIENVLIGEVEKNTDVDSVSTMIDEGSPKIKEWIDRGYVLQPGFQRMSAKLEGLKPIPKVAKGIKLRSLRLDEEKEFVAMINAGFGWQRLELGDLENWKKEDPPFNEEWVQVAEFNHRIVSTVVARPDTAYNRHLHVNRGYLGPAATLPEFRNKHLASALTAQAMNFLFRIGMTMVRLGTSEQNKSSIALLRSLGFQVETVRKILRKKTKKNLNEP